MELCTGSGCADNVFEQTAVYVKKWTDTYILYINWRRQVTKIGKAILTNTLGKELEGRRILEM